MLTPGKRKQIELDIQRLQNRLTILIACEKPEAAAEVSKKISKLLNRLKEGK